MRRCWLGGTFGSSIFLALVANLSAPAGLVPSAFAAVIGSATLVRNPPTIPFSAPDAALGAPWVAYTLDLQATAGEIIAAVDVSITGPLHQRWVFNEDLEAYAPTAISANITSGDSHLRAPAGGLFAFGPSEDNSGTGSPLADTVTSHYGVGSFLRGAWGIPTATQSGNAALAYIVVPSNRIHELSIRVLAANPHGDIIADIGNGCTFFACIDGPQIEVFGQGVMIDDGDATPSLADGTDFGQRGFLDPPLEQTFTISNPGFSRLNLQPPVLTGPYSLVGSFPSLVDEGQSANFTLTLNSPLAPGTYPGSIAFGHDVGTGGTFNFDLTARVVPEPASLSIVGLSLVWCILKVRRRR